MESHYFENRPPLVCFFSVLPWAYFVIVLTSAQIMSCPWRARTIFEFSVPNKCLAHSKNQNKQMNNNTPHIMLTMFIKQCSSYILTYLLFSPHNPMKHVLSLSSFYIWENWSKKVKQGYTESGPKPMHFGSRVQSRNHHTTLAQRRLCFSKRSTSTLCFHL